MATLCSRVRMVLWVWSRRASRSSCEDWTRRNGNSAISNPRVLLTATAPAFCSFILYLATPLQVEQVSFQLGNLSAATFAGQRFQAGWAGIAGLGGKSAPRRLVILTRSIQFFRGCHTHQFCATIRQIREAGGGGEPTGQGWELCPRGRRQNRKREFLCCR